VSTLNFSGGTLSLPVGSTLKVTGGMNWTGGIVGGTAASGGGGVLTVVSGATLSMNGAEVVSGGASVVNEGSGAWTGGSAYLEGAGSRLVNRGTLTVAAAGYGVDVRSNSGGGVFANEGTATVGAAGFTVMNGAGFTNAVGAGLLVSAGAKVSLQNGAFTNQGTCTVGAGATMQVVGDFTNASTGTVALQIAGGGATEIPTIAVSGKATLAGTLQVSTISGFAPAVGQSLTVLTYGQALGTFATLSGTALPDGHQFQGQYGAASFSLVVA
jgi:hypothetical protein